MTTTTPASWNEVRGTLLHRAVLHPGAHKRSVANPFERERYESDSQLMAKRLHKSLEVNDFELARLLASDGGSCRTSVITDYQSLSPSDCAKVLDSFANAVMHITHSLMWKAQMDRWEWLLTEVASPYAHFMALPHAGDRVDIVAGRGAKGLIVADIKTGMAHSSKEEAVTHLGDVRKYAQAYADELGRNVEYQVLYARTENGYSSWDGEATLAKPGAATT